MSQLFDKTTSALGTSINMRQLKNNVISSNIANAETPGYHAKKLDFEEMLSRAIDLEGFGKTHVNHPDHFYMGQGSIARVKPDIYEDPDINHTNDGNTVDLEQEMSRLAENTIMYKAAINLINKKLGAMKYAVTEGGR